MDVTEESPFNVTNLLTSAVYSTNPGFVKIWRKAIQNLPDLNALYRDRTVLLKRIYLNLYKLQTSETGLTKLNCRLAAGVLACQSLTPGRRPLTKSGNSPVIPIAVRIQILLIGSTLSANRSAVVRATLKTPF